LRPGGILVSYLPTINQVMALRSALEESPFAMEETSEILVRTWHVEGRSVRPDHRMVAHTGFLTHARLLGQG
jgi:tRNA (adenine57-N1/adenine58-N1)-methyltransferase